jgi:hypothetical protein
MLKDGNVASIFTTTMCKEFVPISMAAIITFVIL